jgi:hypothetical protein
VPGPYCLLTFTLPAEVRALAWAQPRPLFGLLMQCAWQTLRTFSRNGQHLQGTPGAVAVRHTHSRRLDDLPHGHGIMPAAARDTETQRWRTKTGKGDLFPLKALAKGFRAQLLAAMTEAGLNLPEGHPQQGGADGKPGGSGEKALV